MKYFIQYPLQIECGLKCSYCFHTEAFCMQKEGTFTTKFKEKAPFTFSDYQKWRDKHIPNGTEYLMELHSGEISYGGNKELALSIIDQADKEVFQLQTNGLGDPDFYKELIKRKDKIDRIGFTYHRKPVEEWESRFDIHNYDCNDCPLPFCWKEHCVPTKHDKLNFCPRDLNKIFLCNVMEFHNAGVKVIVKELLHIDRKHEILENKKYWESMGVEFRIQDFREHGGFDVLPYTPEEAGLVHPEYLHGGENCSCRVGYKNVIIRGCDIYGGDVLGCWHDPAQVGNIVDDWYNPEYTVGYDQYHNIDVKTPGKKKLYHGGFEKDVWSPDIEKLYPHRERNYKNYDYIKQKGVSIMVSVNQNLIEAQKAQLAEVNKRIAHLRQQLDEETIRRIRLEGGIDSLQYAIMEEEKLSRASQQEAPDVQTFETIKEEDKEKIAREEAEGLSVVEQVRK